MSTQLELLPENPNEPKVGEIRDAIDAGFHWKKHQSKVIWIPCANCGKKRWVRFVKDKPMSERCIKCSHISRKIIATQFNPQLGDIKNAEELGLIGSNKLIWLACPNCGKPDWKRLYKGKPTGNLCHHCAGRLPRKRRPAIWKYGSRKNQGYKMVKLHKTDLFYAMADGKNYVMEHRLVMAEHLGRCLERWEIVHHKNHIRDDNRIENLELLSNPVHQEITILGNRVKFLESRVTMLEIENITLRKQLEVAI